jgi:hypothetical protein
MIPRTCRTWYGLALPAPLSCRLTSGRSGREGCRYMRCEPRLRSSTYPRRLSIPHKSRNRIFAGLRRAPSTSSRQRATEVYDTVYGTTSPYRPQVMTRKLRSDMVDVPHLTRARRVVGRRTGKNEFTDGCGSAVSRPRKRRGPEIRRFLDKTPTFILPGGRGSEASSYFQYPAKPMSVVACASGSVHTLTSAGLPLLNARSIAPRMPSGFSTNSP